MRRDGLLGGTMGWGQLVVESYGYNDKTWLDGNGSPHTEALRVTERYRRGNFGHMDIEVTQWLGGSFSQTVMSPHTWCVTSSIRSSLAH